MSSATARKKPQKPAISTVIPLPEKAETAAFKKALAFQAQRKYAEAVKAYDEVLTEHPGRIAAIVNKGAALRHMRRHEAAMVCFWQALAIEPQNVQAWHNAGQTLLDMNRDDEARAALSAAVAKAPDLPEIWSALSRLLLKHRMFAAAEVTLRRALALRLDDLELRLELGALLLEVGRQEEAFEAYKAIQQSHPTEPQGWSGAGQAITGLGLLDEGRRMMEHALTLKPDHMDARLGLARWHLLTGGFDKGWEYYETRRSRTDSKKPKIEGTEWDGSDPSGKTVLVYAEQGFGDTLQFLRYLPLLAARGARVIVVCQKSIVSLARQVEGVAEADCKWRPLPAYDCFTPLLSLPHKLRLGNDIPAAPYIKTAKKAQLPLPPLGTKLRVGLVWAGSATNPNDPIRSAGLETLLPLAGVDGVRLYSLQVGPRAGDVDKLAHPALIKDLSKHLKDYADTAAVIEQLDLVIAVDTSVAHLAGGMGKPVWALVPSIPDWRWQTQRTDSPWYPTMRLYRNNLDNDWTPVVQQLVKDLQALVKDKPAILREPETITAHSVFSDAKGKPRFTMTAPRGYMTDPGVGFLMRKERSGIGYEYATRSLLEAHINPGDVFLDIGAHWGVMSLHVATSMAAKDKKSPVDILAFEPSPRNQTPLREWIKGNGVEKRIEIIPAAASDKVGHGTLKPESTMGHSLVPAKDGDIEVVTIDDIMASRGHLKNRRVIVKIDVEGHEPEVIAGMRHLLSSGQVAMVIWERGVEYNTAKGQERLTALRRVFADAGFTAWRFEDEDAAGALVPFVEDGRNGNIVELANGVSPLNTYGSPRPVPVAQPEDAVFDIAEQARNHFIAGTRAYEKGRLDDSISHYAESAMLDTRNKDLFNNLGIMMRDKNLHPAKIACYRRAHMLRPDDAGIASNLANALREDGRFEETAPLNKIALDRAPNDAGFIYNAALVLRDTGKPQAALEMLDRSLTIKPDNADAVWDRALLQLQQGDYAAGFPAYESRWGIRKALMRDIPLPRWQGEPLDGRSVFLHDEQGFGDVMQFARFIPELKSRGAGKIVLECQPQLMRLMALAPGVDAVVPRHRALPQCDVYAPLLSLPGIFGTTLETLTAEVPYLFAPEMSAAAQKAFPQDNRFKLGLVWAGQVLPRDRSCPLQKLLPHLGDPRIAPISLQVGQRAQDLKTTGADTFITNMAPYLVDFAETAAVLEKLDALITIDTSVAHLAGALGVPTMLLLRYTSDWRWFDNIATSPWYPGFKLFRQTEMCRWDEPLREMGIQLRVFVDEWN